MIFNEPEYQGLRKVISGGQTGADQGGLLAAIKSNIATGGTAAAGFRTQAGPNVLLELLGLEAAGTYSARTKKNIQDSDGTIIIARDLSSAGTKLTLDLCRSLQKPFKVFTIPHVDLAERAVLDAPEGAQFISSNKINVLNVAGNRDAGDLTITRYAEFLMTLIFDRLNQR